MTQPLNMDITEKASEMLNQALSTEENAGHVVRVVARRVSPVRFRYQMALEGKDLAHEDDREIQTGEAVIRTDAGSAEILSDVKLDYIDGGESGSGFKFLHPAEEKGWEDPIAQKFQLLLDEEINPGIASHGGFIDLVDYKDGKAYVSMGGGCQGCGMAKVTLREGVEARVKELIPEIEEIVDSTDHGAGQGPYHE